MTYHQNLGVLWKVQRLFGLSVKDYFLHGFCPWSLILTLCFPHCNFWSSGYECSYKNQVTSPLSSTSCLLYGAPSPPSLSAALGSGLSLVATFWSENHIPWIQWVVNWWLDYSIHTWLLLLGNSLGSITSRLCLSLAWILVSTHLLLLGSSPLTCAFQPSCLSLAIYHMLKEKCIMDTYSDKSELEDKCA